MASAKITLYKSKTLKNGTHPIVVQVIHGRSPKKFSTGLSCKESQWDNFARRFNPTFPNYRKKNSVLLQLDAKLDDIMAEFQSGKREFTFIQFERLYRKSSRNITVYEFIDDLIKEFIKKGRVGNAKVYTDMKRSLYKYKPKDHLMFPDIDYKFLTGFETFLYSDGYSGGGISVYMRTLRVVVNEAIRRQEMSHELYPFKSNLSVGGYSLSHLKSKASPRAMSMVEMEMFKAFKVEEHPEHQIHFKYFLFSYYARGMNFTDMAKLKWSDIYNGRINYVREKTGGHFTIKITHIIQAILDNFKSESQYVFPVLNKDKHKTPMQVKNRITRCLKEYNKGLKEIARLAKITTPITSYTSRHQFAMALKHNSIDVGIISETLGHKNINVTKAYLKNFDNAIIDKAVEVL